MLVDVHVAVLALLLKDKVLLLPLVCLVLLLGEEALHLHPLLLLWIRLFAAFAQRGVDLFRRRLFRLLLQRGKGAVVLTTLLLDVLAERVTLHNLLRLVAVDHCVQTFKGPPAHHVTNALLFDSKALDLIVDVEEEGIVAGRIVAGPHQETARAGSHQQVYRLRLAQVAVEPGEHGIRVDGVVQIGEQVLEARGIF